MLKDGKINAGTFIFIFFDAIGKFPTFLDWTNPSRPRRKPDKLLYSPQYCSAILNLQPPSINRNPKPTELKKKKNEKKCNLTKIKPKLP